MIGAAVVGLNAGLRHVLGYLDSPHVELKAVCDLVPDKFAAVQQLAPVDTYRDLDEMLARDDIQLVSVCTPDYTHREVATQVLRANKHLFLEKPIAQTLDDAQAILAEADKAGTYAGISYDFHVNPVIAGIKELLDSGRLGQLKNLVLSYWRGPFFYSKPSQWIQRLECSGGLIVAEACHWFDLARWLGGEIREVQCQGIGGIHPETDFEDIILANVQLTSGAVAQINHSLGGFGTAMLVWAVGTESSAWGYIKEDESPFLGLGWPGEFGRLALIEGHPRTDAEKLRFEDGVLVRSFGVEARESDNTSRHAQLFAACLADGAPPPVSLADGLQALEISLAARASALQSGASVSIPLTSEMHQLATSALLVEGTMARERRAIRAHLGAG